MGVEAQGKNDTQERASIKIPKWVTDNNLNQNAYITVINTMRVEFSSYQPERIQVILNGEINPLQCSDTDIQTIILTMKALFQEQRGRESQVSSTCTNGKLAITGTGEEIEALTLTGFSGSKDYPQEVKYNDPEVELGLFVQRYLDGNTTGRSFAMSANPVDRDNPLPGDALYLNVKTTLAQYQVKELAVKYLGDDALNPNFKISSVSPKDGGAPNTYFIEITKSPEELKDNAKFQNTQNALETEKEGPVR